MLAFSFYFDICSLLMIFGLGLGIGWITVAVQVVTSQLGN